MSYDVYLCDPVTNETLQFNTPHQYRGGTYCLGGTTEAWLNVTYNYAAILAQVLPEIDAKTWGIRSLSGLTGAESIPILEAAIAKLGDDVAENYWTATEGNVKRCLQNCLELARLAPQGIWKVR